MFFINLTQPITLLLVLAAVILLIFLSQEIKNSFVGILPLFASLGLLIMHTVQRFTLAQEYSDLSTAITVSIAIDFGLVLISFFAYLWADEVEAKEANKKTIDNSLDWFWKQV